MGTESIGTRRLVAILLVMATVAAMLVARAGVASAEPGGVVISELNYHAGSDLDGDDFVELTNTGAAPIDVSGWSFTAGVTGTLPASSVIAPGGYYVVAKDAVQFQATYGFAPDAIYGGNLSNGGETVTIADAAPATVDSVTYADLAPWPGAPDGTGPSLELTDLLADNTAGRGVAREHGRQRHAARRRTRSPAPRSSRRSRRRRSAPTRTRRSPFPPACRSARPRSSPTR